MGKMCAKGGQVERVCSTQQGLEGVRRGAGGLLHNPRHPLLLPAAPNEAPSPPSKGLGRALRPAPLPKGPARSKGPPPHSQRAPHTPKGPPRFRKAPLKTCATSTGPPYLKGLSLEWPTTSATSSRAGSSNMHISRSSCRARGVGVGVGLTLWRGVIECGMA